MVRKKGGHKDEGIQTEELPKHETKFNNKFWSVWTHKYTKSFKK